MPYSATKVANELLRLAGACDPPRPVTPLQLLKLVYIANGWSLAFYDTPLVHEAAEAWTYGPVIPSLYRSIRHFRASPVEGPIPGDYDQNELADHDRELIAAVYRAYGHLSGPQLSNMTHLPGTPWSAAWANGAGQNNIIRSENIREHYQTLAARQTA
jgi:uncharacterized phage-associated protein